MTGIKPAGEGVATVEFTWKEVPTKAGEALDPRSDTFKRLPEALQQGITHRQGGLLGSGGMMMKFTEAKQLAADF